jgi:putative tricarboxylic transport membrane protein
MKSVFRVATVTIAASLVLTGCSAAVVGDASEEFAATGTNRIVVAMAAGGGSDRSGRVMSQILNENEGGYSTVVENREGGGGAVGWSYFSALTGQPDNLLVAETALHTLPLQEGVDVPFTYKDFTPIALFAEDSRMVVAPVDSPYDTCADLIDAGASADLLGGISGTFGADGMVLASMEEAGLVADRVPYGSTGEVVTGLLGGQIDFAPASAAAVKPYIESGDFKGLCTFSAERYSSDPVLADVETALEQDIDATVVLWRGVLAPAGISDAARDFWVDEFKTAFESSAYTDYLEADLLIPKQIYGDDFATYLDAYDAEIQTYFTS